MGSQTSRGQPIPHHRPNLNHQQHYDQSYDRDNADTVPIVFTWTAGANEVRLCIESLEWRELPMVRSGVNFQYVYDLPRGKHRYKFLVDGECSFAPDQPCDHVVEEDNEERIVNFIDTSDFDKNAFLVDKGWDICDADLLYTQRLPDISEYTADAPHIPALLHKSPYLAIDVLSRDPPPNVPLFSMCGHVYHDGGSTMRRFGLSGIVSAVTHRYKGKYSTTVFVRRKEEDVVEVGEGGANVMRMCMRKRKRVLDGREMCEEGGGTTAF